MPFLSLKNQAVKIYGGGGQHQLQDLAAATARAAIAGPQRPGLGSGAAALHRPPMQLSARLI